VAVLLAAVLWGTTGTVAHFAPAGSSPVLIGMSTFGFGGLILFALDVRGTLTVLRERGNWGWLLVGGAGVILYPTTYYASMSLVGVAIGNVLALGSGPIFAAVIEWLVLRRRLTGRWAVATATAVVGVAFLSSSAHSAPGSSPVLGIVLALAAGLGYAAYSVAGSALIGRGAGSASAMGGVFVTGSAVMVPWVVIAGPGPLAAPSGVAILAYLAVVPMALSYLLFGYGLRALSASVATTLALGEPVVATLLAVLVVGEQLTPLAWTGLLLVGLGISITALRRPIRPRRPGAAGTPGPS
jgi:DME family drug/metabolite transporter